MANRWEERSGISWKEHLELRALVIFEQDFGCGGCGDHITHHKNSCHLHHLNENPKDNHRDNLIVLCPYCHFEAHGWLTSETRGFYARKKQPTRKQLVESKIKKLNGYVK